MTRTFIQTDEFSRNWDEFGFTDDDLRRLEFDIMMNPHKYPVMQGTKKQKDNLSKQERNNINIYIDRLRDNI